MISNFKNITAEINLNSIRHNISYFKKKSQTGVIPVLKGNAYGHGMVEIAKTCRLMGINYISVATVGEAIYLRRCGDKGRILAWIYNINNKELIEAFNLKIDIAIYSAKTLDLFIKKIPPNYQIKVTLYVDTGINRQGIPYREAIQVAKRIKECKKMKLVGIMSHLINSEIKNSPLVLSQLAKFRYLIKQLKSIHINPMFTHIANTSAVLNYDVSDFTHCRIGAGIYGIPLVKTPLPQLKLSMTLKSIIIQIKSIKAGEGIGYQWTYIAPKDMSIAIVPIGWVDAIPTSSNRNLYVYINKTKRKVFGLINMDQIIVQASKQDRLGDTVFIFGDRINCPQTIYDITKMGHLSIPYLITSTLGTRVKRKYLI